MTLLGKQNHYNVKFLKGYGFSIKVKDSKIILKNCSDPFKEPEVEEWFGKNPQKSIKQFPTNHNARYNLVSFSFCVWEGDSIFTRCRCIRLELARLVLIPFSF